MVGQRNRIVDAKFPKDVAPVVADRLEAEAQVASDRARGAALGYQNRYLLFAFGQAIFLTVQVDARQAALDARVQVGGARDGAVDTVFELAKRCMAGDDTRESSR